MSKTYKTIQGDMWDSIAYSQMGDEKYTDILINANSKYRNTYIFSSGEELVIPDVPTRYDFNDLPPWKKVNT